MNYYNNYLIRLDKLDKDFDLRCFIEFYVGVYALYAAQIKWHFPHLIGNSEVFRGRFIPILGNEHMAIRDHVMHGIEHSYSQHIQEEGTKQLLNHVYYLFGIKSKLELFLSNDCK